MKFFTGSRQFNGFGSKDASRTTLCLKNHNSIHDELVSDSRDLAMPMSIES